MEEINKYYKSDFYYSLKRVFDFTVALVLLIFLSWLFLILAIVIKLVDKGSVFYKEERIGLNNNPFNIIKFNTMVNDSYDINKYFTKEQKELYLRERKIDNDPRTTRLGRVLRKTSLDELPQLINILKGDMSLVGPRPIVKEECLRYSDEQLKIFLLAKPGLTGLWQVSGRNDIEYVDGKRQEIELEYVLKRSLLFDLKIIFLTIPALLTEEGAK